MRRDLKLIKHLLDMIQAYADRDGIYLHHLIPKWEASSGNPDKPLSEDELIYHLNLCGNAGLLAIDGGNLIQMTWAGHDYLDAQTVSHTA